jgi:ABC-type phosphate/phosphonate transport system substrate-binding protein
VVQRSYHDALEQIRKGGVDGGWLGSAPGAYAFEAAGYLPVARMEDLRGDSFYRSSIFRRKESAVTADPSTWGGKVFAFPSRTTSAGFLYPVAYMRARGVKDPLGFLSSASIFTGSHDTALWAVANGRAELGACKSTVFNSVMESSPDIRGRVEVVHVGGSFPLDSLFLRPSLEEPLRGEIRRALLAMEADPQAAAALKRLGARRMVVTTKDDYQEVHRTLKDAGYDIKGFLALMEAER